MCLLHAERCLQTLPLKSCFTKLQIQTTSSNSESFSSYSSSSEATCTDNLQSDESLELEEAEVDIASIRAYKDGALALAPSWQS